VLAAGASAATKGLRAVVLASSTSKCGSCKLQQQPYRRHHLQHLPSLSSTDLLQLDPSIALLINRSYKNLSRALQSPASLRDCLNPGLLLLLRGRRVPLPAHVRLQQQYGSTNGSSS
jgi:hypothetical protein